MRKISITLFLLSLIYTKHLIAKDLNIFFQNKRTSMFDIKIDFNQLNLTDKELERALRVQFKYENNLHRLKDNSYIDIRDFIEITGFNGARFIKKNRERDIELIYSKTKYLKEFLDILTKKQILKLKEMINDKNINDRR